MKAVELRNLGVSHGEREVFSGLSLAVETGEFIGIIGPNGSGKTSLLRALSGLLPCQGEVRIFGRPLGDYGRRQLAVTLALVPQQSPVDLPFTVAEIVMMGRSPHLGLMGFEGERDFAIVRRALEFTGVEEFAERRPVELSGGERQRVVIARAICQEPRLILLDEPTAALDPAHQIRILDLMERLRRERGMTVIMVSHDLNLAALYSDRLVLLAGGAIRAAGPPLEVLTEETLLEAYGCRMAVELHGGEPRVFPLPNAVGC